MIWPPSTAATRPSTLIVRTVTLPASETRSLVERVNGDLGGFADDGVLEVAGAEVGVSAAEPCQLPPPPA